jgi:hypothetical protein
MATAAMEKEAVATSTPKKRRPRFVRVMGMRDVAEAVGVDKTNLSKISDLPAHAQMTSSGRIWREDEILDFAKVYRERTGRPELDLVEWARRYEGA